MGKTGQCASEEVSLEESVFLMDVIRRFESGVTEGHLHTLMYVGQKLNFLPPRYEFQFQQLVPFCEDLDLKIALLLWNNAVCIRDNRIRVVSRPAAGRAPAAMSDCVVQAGLSLDKLIAFSYDALKCMAVMVYMERDLQKSRQEAFTAAVRLFPVHEEQVQKWVQDLSV